MDSGQTGNFTGRIAGLVPGAPGANFGIRVYTMIRGQRRKMGLGSCEDVPLATREKARELRRKIRNGIDRRKRRAPARQYY